MFGGMRFHFPIVFLAAMVVLSVSAQNSSKRIRLNPLRAPYARFCGIHLASTARSSGSVAKSRLVKIAADLSYCAQLSRVCMATKLGCIYI